jgi:hypothetical protein
MLLSWDAKKSAVVNVVVFFISLNFFLQQVHAISNFLLCQDTDSVKNKINYTVFCFFNSFYDIIHIVVNKYDQCLAISMTFGMIGTEISDALGNYMH